MIEAVQAIQNAIDIVVKLRDLSKKVGDANFKMLLADLSSDLADAKLDAASLKAELARLRDENSELKARLTQRDSDKPSAVDEVYRFEGDDNSYCTACYDVHERKVRLRRMTGEWTVFGAWECPSCKGDCQDFRVWAGIMGKKETHYVPTQGAVDSG
ncbi:hypothetical protein [Sphingobium fluviale]|uniref:hypothetical protein n=1 Tax=Sphingobium fluviale TaxID=2506423 RepID=UPI0015F2CE7E|nr:hypothetical protein [Sphingobium fluviale]